MPGTIVFGKSVLLSGVVTRGGAPVAGEAVTLAAQPVGSAVFVPFAPVLTDANGNFRIDVKPTKKTTYKAGYGEFRPSPL